MAQPVVTGSSLMMRQPLQYQLRRPTGVLPGHYGPVRRAVASGGVAAANVSANPVATGRTGSGATASAGMVAFASGATSGLVTTVTLQPLDLVKTRVQLADGATVRTVVTQAPSWVGLWDGLRPSLARTVPGIGLYFLTLDAMRSISQSVIGELHAMHNFAIGASARTFVGLGTLPLTVVKARVESGRYVYPTVFRGLQSIYVTEGLRGLFSGSAATALRDAPFSGVYLACYTPAKSFLRSRVGDGHWLHQLSVTAAAGLYAGTIASAVTQPQDVIKTQMQVDPALNPTFWSTFKRICHEQGSAGLFRGLRVRIFRRTLVATLSWTIYEQVSPVLTKASLHS